MTPELAWRIWRQLIVFIRRNETGEVRRFEDLWPYPDDEEGLKWYWTDGNRGCDCNRHLDFERAGGTPLANDDALECGYDKYAVKIVTSTGETLLDELEGA